jgi:Uma2 family endonuclease
MGGSTSIYAREGVTCPWLVDPGAHLLEHYAQQFEQGWLLLATLKKKDEVRQPLFDTIAFPLGRL